MVGKYTRCCVGIHPPARHMVFFHAALSESIELALRRCALGKARDLGESVAALLTGVGSEGNTNAHRYRRGIPLAVRYTTSTTRRCSRSEDVLGARGDAVQPVRRPRRRSEKLHADKGYDFRYCREALRKRGIKARIPRWSVDSSAQDGTVGCGRVDVAESLSAPEDAL
jgi:hypothetical protein